MVYSHIFLFLISAIENIQCKFLEDAGVLQSVQC